MSATAAKDEITNWFEPKQGENLLPMNIANLRDEGIHSS